jgi:hypothetical protein
MFFFLFLLLGVGHLVLLVVLFFILFIVLNVLFL